MSEHRTTESGFARSLRFIPGVLVGTWIGVWMGWVSSDYGIGASVMALFVFIANGFYDWRQS